MIKPHIRTVIIQNIDPDKFSMLYSEYGESLSCPCTSIAIPYEIFVLSTIKFHPVCSSLFISQQWIEALYLPSRSKYGVGDFRTTASSQVENQIF